MINRNTNQLDSSPLTEKTLSYVFGQYGADKHIPHIYEESNWHCTPATCNCVVLDKDCAEYVYNHLSNHYPSALNDMRTEDPALMESFNRNYIQKYSSDIKKEPSDKNLSFGNFSLMKISTCLKKDFMMLFPDSINGISLKSALPLLEAYLMSHGKFPNKASKFTALAFSYLVRSAVAREGNSLSGYYRMNDVKMKDGWTFKGINANGAEASCVFSKIGKRNSDGTAPQETVMKKISSLDVHQMQQLICAAKDFCKLFKQYLPAIQKVKEIAKPKVAPKTSTGLKH